MKVTVHDNNKGEPVAMVLPNGDLNIRTLGNKVMLIDNSGIVDKLSTLDFDEEVSRYSNEVDTKLIYPGAKITIEL